MDRLLNKFGIFFAGKKIRAQRVRNDWNWLILLSIFFSVQGFHWWYLALIPVLIGWSLFDKKFIQPHEGNYSSKINLYTKRIEEKLDHLIKLNGGFTDD